MALKKVMHSNLRGTLAEILAATGDYKGQSAFATDHGVGTNPNQPGLEFYWNGLNWRLPPKWQLLAMLRSQVVMPATNVETTGLSYTLPALGPNTLLRACHFWTSTSNANAKTARVKLDTQNGQQIDLASSAVSNFVTEGRNYNDASVQKWYSNNKAVYGSTSGTMAATTIATGTAGKVFIITGQNSTAADVMNLEWADMWICGGGTA